MTGRKRNAPSYHDPQSGTGTSDNVVRPNDFLDISVDDYELPCGEEIIFNFNVGGNTDHPSTWGSQSTQFVNDPSEAGPSGVHDQRGGQNAGYFVPENSAFENPTQFFELLGPPRQYDCTYCQVLRNIVHIKGQELRAKLEIHGRIGMVCHGILQVHIGDMTAPNKEYHTFDFCKKSISDVKKFLVEYFENRKKDYYTIVNDPLVQFYETLSARSDWDSVSSDDNEGSPGNIGKNQPEAQGGEARPRKRTYKEQKEFVKSLTIKDFARYFHLREHEAAKHVGISPTTLKNICRKAGLKRWPFRKVGANERSIKKIADTTDQSDSRKKAKAEKKLEKLQNERAVIYGPYR